MSVVVRPAINGVVRRWTWTNVCQKIRKVLSPFVAHPNTAPAPVMEFAAALVVAPPFHRFPRLVFRRLVASGVPVREVSRSSCVALQTPTALRVSLEVAPAYNGDGPAIAATSPIHAVVLPIGPRQHSEATNALSRQINQRSHDANYIVNPLLEAI